ncbi:cofilin [Strongylocentrotus purpuratus]|uniref:ADF-H domain-containing protein n=1 Tax=Strongylocentrotus purpuratus TaxID=7668 RepID=A0A7M7T5K3_STRPU|nr:cofilin [Strongylocentrotus purpuratus]
MPKSSMSGVSVPEEIQKTITDLKQKKFQYAVFQFKDLGVVDDKKVVGWTQVAVGERFEGCRGTKAHLTIEEDILRTEYTKFVAEYMDPESALFVLYDFSVVKIDNVKTKIIGIQWCPDNLGVKSKMGYASSVEELKKECLGPTVVYVQNELSEIDYDSIIKEFASKN